MKTPTDKTIAFTFGSHPEKDLSRRWQARLEFPPGSVGESLLKISIVDGNGAPVRDGQFEFAGKQLMVRDGQAEITYAEFIAGKHSTSLWLHRPGMDAIPGGLTFA